MLGAEFPVWDWPWTSDLELHETQDSFILVHFYNFSVR